MNTEQPEPAADAIPILVVDDNASALYVTGRNAELLRNRLRISRYEPL